MRHGDSRFPSLDKARDAAYFDRLWFCHPYHAIIHGGALVSTGMLEAMAAGRGAAGLVKSGNKVIANNDYEYAYAA